MPKVNIIRHDDLDASLQAYREKHNPIVWDMAVLFYQLSSAQRDDLINETLAGEMQNGLQSLLAAIGLKQADVLAACEDISTIEQAHVANLAKGDAKLDEFERMLEESGIKVIRMKEDDISMDELPDVLRGLLGKGDETAEG